MIKAVVFDLDDTLVSETKYQDSARKAVLAYLAELTDVPLLEVSKLSIVAEDGPRNEYFQRLLILLGLESTDENVQLLLSTHRSHFPALSWYPDVLESVKGLRELGAKLGIITDGYSIAQHQKLKAVNASKHFDAIVVSDDLGREYWKPHPRTFQLVAKQLGILPSEIVYVGDNPEKDFYISHTLGVKTARVIREDSIKSSRAYKEGVREDFLLEEFEKIVPLFTFLNKEDKHA